MNSLIHKYYYPVAVKGQRVLLFVLVFTLSDLKSSFLFIKDVNLPSDFFIVAYLKQYHSKNLYGDATNAYCTYQIMLLHLSSLCGLKLILHKLQPILFDVPLIDHWYDKLNTYLNCKD